MTRTQDGNIITLDFYELEFFTSKGIFFIGEIRQTFDSEEDAMDYIKSSRPKQLFKKHGVTEIRCVHRHDTTEYLPIRKLVEVINQ